MVSADIISGPPVADLLARLRWELAPSNMAATSTVHSAAIFVFYIQLSEVKLLFYKHFERTMWILGRMRTGVVDLWTFSHITDRRYNVEEVSCRSCLVPWQKLPGPLLVVVHMQSNY